MAWRLIDSQQLKPATISVKRHRMASEVSNELCLSATWAVLHQCFVLSKSILSMFLLFERILGKAPMLKNSARRHQPMTTKHAHVQQPYLPYLLHK